PANETGAGSAPRHRSADATGPVRRAKREGARANDGKIGSWTGTGFEVAFQGFTCRAPFEAPASGRVRREAKAIQGAAVREGLGQVQPEQPGGRFAAAGVSFVARDDLRLPSLGSPLRHNKRKRRLRELNDASPVRLRRDKEFTGDTFGASLWPPDRLPFPDVPTGTGEINRWLHRKRPATGEY